MIKINSEEYTMIKLNHDFFWEFLLGQCLAGFLNVRAASPDLIIIVDFLCIKYGK